MYEARNIDSRNISQSRHIRGAVPGLFYKNTRRYRDESEMREGQLCRWSWVPRGKEDMKIVASRDCTYSNIEFRYIVSIHQSSER